MELLKGILGTGYVIATFVGIFSLTSLMVGGDEVLESSMINSVAFTLLVCLLWPVALIPALIWLAFFYRGED